MLSEITCSSEQEYFLSIHFMNNVYVIEFIKQNAIILHVCVFSI